MKKKIVTVLVGKKEDIEYIEKQIRELARHEEVVSYHSEEEARTVKELEQEIKSDLEEIKEHIREYERTVNGKRGNKKAVNYLYTLYRYRDKLEDTLKLVRAYNRETKGIILVIDRYAFLQND